MQPVPRYRQTDRISDHVFPVVKVKVVNGEIDVDAVLGTGFFIGGNFCLTAGHVLDPLQNGDIAGIILNDGLGFWRFFAITARERHARADIAIFSVEPISVVKSWSSIFYVSGDYENMAQSYRLFGYPVDAMYDLVENGLSQQRPDLVYTQGYIRRRLSFSLPGIRGEAFYELSARAGGGYSGGPIVSMEPGEKWRVFGMYIAERTSSEGIAVGYGLRFDDIDDWEPAIYGGRPIAPGTFSGWTTLFVTGNKPDCRNNQASRGLSRSSSASTMRWRIESWIGNLST